MDKVVSKEERERAIKELAADVKEAQRRFCQSIINCAFSSTGRELDEYKEDE